MNPLNLINMARNFAVVAFVVGCNASAQDVPPTQLNSPPPVERASKVKLPELVTKTHPGLKLKGYGELRFFGIKVYDAALFTPDNSLSLDEPLALEITYNISLKGQDIAKRSAQEMRKIGYTDESKLAQWHERMVQIFPDVAKGDQLIGVMVVSNGKAHAAQFYSSGRELGMVEDAEFAKAFFEIWLSTKTSEPRLRARLTGKIK